MSKKGDLLSILLRFRDQFQSFIGEVSFHGHDLVIYVGDVTKTTLCSKSYVLF